MPRQLFAATRYLLGAIFLVFGLNGFFQFIPVPPLAPKAQAFMGAMIATGYLLILVKAIEVLAGIALLLNRRVPLALILLGPIVVNILLFHLVLDPGGAFIGVFVAGLWGALLYDQRAVYRPLFRD